MHSQGSIGDSSFVIRNVFGIFIIAKSVQIFDTTVSMAELHDVSEGLSHALYHLYASQIWVEGNSMIVVK